MPIGIFASAIFLSAFLLFWVQPLFSKMVLPLLGGSPSVWNTAMMFFQVMLLAGYGYAHLLTSRVARLRSQLLIHGAVVGGGLMFLPFAVSHGLLPPAGVFSGTLACLASGGFGGLALFCPVGVRAAVADLVRAE